MLQQVLVWSIPFCIIPISLIVNRYLPFRTIRYGLYGLFLVAAFVCNLFQASFWNEMADSAAVTFMVFIFADFFWNILRLKNRRVVTTGLLLGAIVFGAAHFRWITSGPLKVWKFSNHAVVSSFVREGVSYAVKEQDLFYLKQPVRVFTLTRRLGTWPFEKKIHSYRTPDGFYGTNFTFLWSETDQGARVDLRTAGYTLWTMGEGF